LVPISNFECSPPFELRLAKINQATKAALERIEPLVNIGSVVQIAALNSPYVPLPAVESATGGGIAADRGRRGLPESTTWAFLALSQPSSIVGPLLA
jgi:hypothetical protein